MSMDRELFEAACSGDVNFLKKALEEKPMEFFTTQFKPGPNDKANFAESNIFHLTARRERVEFTRLAMEKLPKPLQHRLLSQQKSSGWNPLHSAAKVSEKNLELLRLMLAFYNDNYNDNDKPWLAVTKDNKTPLHMALEENREASAMELLSMNVGFVCGVVDKDGNSPLFVAVQKGFSRVVEKILTSASSSISLSGRDGFTPLHFAPNCSESVLRLLLENYPEYIDNIDNNKGFSMLHQWAEIGEVWSLSLLLNNDFAAIRTRVYKELICLTEKQSSETPLHIAIRHKHADFVQALLDGYEQGARVAQVAEPVDWILLKMKTSDGDTPLHTALKAKLEDVALRIMSIDSTLCEIKNKEGESPFFLAVSGGCGNAVEEILRTQDPRFDMLVRNDKQTVLHCLQFCTEATARRLVEKYWWIISLADDRGKTAVDVARAAKAYWLEPLLKDPSYTQREDFDWISACEREETQAVLAFIDNCQDLHKLCRDKNDTPLHHIKLTTYKDYLNFLRISSIAEVKNMQDQDGATPLHRALERKDMLLVKVLLTDNGVERNIRDDSGRTPMDLLASLYRETDDWAKMCKQIKVNPFLKTSYIRSGTNLDQMRTTLTVVAALLATITFAAGFTLPGGVDDKTGNAISVKKAAFIVFLLADVYAMCTSMLVLFCLIWSMVSEPDMSQLLVDRSVVILMQSLYGTLLAFMTGIYTVVSHGSFWATILIFVMCSLIAISANRTVLQFILNTIIPTAYKEPEDRMRLLEQGQAGTAELTNMSTAQANHI